MNQRLYPIFFWLHLRFSPSPIKPTPLSPLGRVLRPDRSTRWANVAGVPLSFLTIPPFEISSLLIDRELRAHRLSFFRTP